MENEFIEDVFLVADETGRLSVKTELSGILREIDYIAYRQTDFNKQGLFLRSADGRHIESLGDCNDGYLYIRYTDDRGGHRREEDKITVRLTVAMALPNSKQALQAGLLIQDYIEGYKSKFGHTGSFSEIRSNPVKVWQEETNLGEDKIRNDIALLSFDFDLAYSAPDSCNISSFQFDC